MPAAADRPGVPALLAPLAADPAASGVFCDFDGTLAPIVDDPATARPLPGAVGALASLAARLGRVAVVSGRPASFLATHLGGRGVDLWGVYGLERVAPGGAVVPHTEAGSWRAAVDGAVDRARAELPPGAGVEHKGMSLTLHFRTAAGLEPAVRAWAEQAAAASGLELHPARMSYELRPPIRRDKGSVVAELAAGLGAVCFLGDDAGDLSAFDVLDGLAATGVHTVRVGVHSEEAPPELLARADLVADGPPGVEEVLGALLAAL